MRIVIAALAGLVFGVGILVAGMADPAKVLNFFDVAGIPAGTWDPSLIFVMGGALVVTAIGYRLVFARGRPFAAERFQLPTRKDLDLPLIGGSAIFGIGWGLAGFCPGGAVPALGLGRLEPVIFVAAMMAGIAAVRLARGLARRQAAA